MADAISHVPYDRLVDYALGLLVDADSSEIEAHLAACPICSAAVNRLWLIETELTVTDDDVPPEALLARTIEVSRPAPARASARLRHTLTGFERRLTAVSVALLLTGMALFALAGRTLVEQSQVTIPGDELYPVKRVAEQASLGTTWGVVSRAKFHVHLLRVRVDEILALTESGRYEAVAASISAFQSEIDDTAVAFRAVSYQDVPAGVALVQQAEQSLNDSAQKFSALALAGPPEALPVLRSAVAVSVRGQTVVRAQLPPVALAALVATAPAPTLPAIAATTLASTSQPSPTASLAPSATYATPTVSASPRATVTGTAPLASPTRTATATPAASATPSPTDSATPTQTASATPSRTRTPVPSPTVTRTPTDTAVPTDTDTPLPTVTETPAPTDTDTPVPTATATPLPTDTATPEPSATPLPTDTSTPVPSDTPAPTDTLTPTDTLPPPTDTPPPPTDTPAPTETPPPTATILVEAGT